MLHLKQFTFGTIILLFTTIVSQAQGTCSPLVVQAISALDTNCSTTERNEACYGYNSVSAGFTEPVADDYFAEPSDITPINIVEKIQTAPMNINNEVWGVAIMKLQASLPDSLPGQALTFVLIGEGEVENAVDPSSMFIPAQAITISSSVIANIRSGAGLTFNPLGSVPANTSLQADARSADDQWVRVAYTERTGWISRTVIVPDPAIDSLPMLTEDTRMPMQAFYLRTGVGNPDCEEAPRDTLMVQSPENIKVEISVNGVNVRMGSTVLFNTPEEEVLEITVLDGEATLLGEDYLSEEDDILIPQGYTTQACLDEPQELGLDGDTNDRLVGCEFSTPQAIPLSELREEWCFLGDIPTSVINYSISDFCSNASDGSVLPAGSCRNFRLAQPIDGTAPYFETVYEWTPITGADQYIVNFFNSQNSFMNSFFIPGDQNSTVISSAPFADSIFTWEVTALQGNQTLCTSPRSPQITRQEPPRNTVDSGGEVTGTVSVTVTCVIPNVAQLSWSGLTTSGNTTITWSGTTSGSSSANTGSSSTYSSTPTLPGIVSYTISPSGQSGTFNLIC
jgi:uncharacterized protein YgiM (DUF1202 family)